MEQKNKKIEVIVRALEEKANSSDVKKIKEILNTITNTINVDIPTMKDKISVLESQNAENEEVIARALIEINDRLNSLNLQIYE